MGSPLGPLLANTFMCSVEEKLEEKDELPSFYKEYVDDTLTIMPDLNEDNIFPGQTELLPQKLEIHHGDS